MREGVARTERATPSRVYAWSHIIMRNRAALPLSVSW